MDRYNPAEIEKKWQKIWEETEAFKAPSLDEIDKKQAKMYLAEMFPYPSGAGLHVGHVRNFTIVDVLTRFYTQQEMNVLRPFGYDTFGLPAENYAIKTGTAPQEVTKENIANFRRQAKKLGFAIDWLREINTSNPEYYKWTQWCFRQLYKKGLAYRKESYQWWCPVDQTVLANEQVENGRCWRCGAEVEKKKMKQWFFKITAYADELLDEIDALDWPDKIKTMQKNWIGRSEGAEIDFTLADAAELSAQARCETEAPRAVGVGSPHPSEPRLEREAEDSKLSDANIVIRNKTIKKVTEDLHRVSFNTAVAALMEYVNELYKNGTTAEDNIVLAKLLKPFAPHLACEILEKYGVGDIWPVWDESALVEDTVEVVVQVNGKLRAKIQVSTEDLANEEKLTELALKEENVARRISGAPKKVVIPKNAKLINIVA